MKKQKIQTLIIKKVLTDIPNSQLLKKGRKTFTLNDLKVTIQVDNFHVFLVSGNFVKWFKAM